MTPTGYNLSEFSEKVQICEKQAYTFAIDKATGIANTQSDVLVFVVARKICNRAFAIFKESMKNAFPPGSYTSLVDLTLSEKGGDRFIKLEQKLIEILSNQGVKPEAPSQGVKC